MATTAAAPATLRSFLQGRRVTSSAWNLTGMSTDAGKYYIPDDEYGIFLQRYHDHVFVRNQPAHLLERHSPDASPVLIDLDFRYALGDETATRRYTSDNIHHFMTEYTAALHRFIVITESIRFYIQEIPTPLTEKGEIKDGIHIICPDLALRYDDLFALRRYTMEQGIIETAFPGLTNSSADCFDVSVIRRNNWFLYGSSKSSQRPPYAVTTCYVLDPDGSLITESIYCSNEELVTAFSIRTLGPTEYSIRPDMTEEWHTWTAISDQKPAVTIAEKEKLSEALVPAAAAADNESVTSHMSDNICKIIKQPGLVWEIAQMDDGYKLTHNSKRCLVVPDAEHSTIGHSCVFVTEANAKVVCFSHKSKRLPKNIAIALWNMLSNKPAIEDFESRYSSLKTEFEKRTFRILDPPGYMTYINTKWVHYTRTQLLDMNSGMFLDDDKKIRFIDQWLKDDTIRTYASMDYFVDPADCPPNVFNTFDGLAASHLPVVPDADISPILAHFDILSNHDEPAREFMLDWFASIVQKPWKLTGIAMVIMGTHGCGKDIMLTWFGSQIVGLKNYYKTSRPHIDLFSSFNSSRKNVIFYHIEEGNADVFPPSMVEQFKNYITDPYASIQMKNINSMELCRNYNNFAVSSNSKNPYHIAPTARQQTAVEASPEKAKDTDYFQKLSAAMANKGVVRAFYDFLMSRDLTTRDWLNPPVTAALKAWKSECMPRLSSFIEYYKSTVELPCTVLSSQMYSTYVEWCESVTEDVLTLRHFGMEMKNIQCVKKAHSMAGTAYLIS